MERREPRALVALAFVLAAALFLSAAVDFVPPRFHGDVSASTSVPFATNVRITDGTTGFPQHVEPTLTVDAQGLLVAGWKEALTATGVGQRVAYARSEDGGQTWSANTLKATTSDGMRQSDPWLTLDGSGGLHYASLEYNADGTIGGVTVTNSADGGRTWSAAVQVDDRPGFADKEAMASDGGGNLYVVYDDVIGQTSDQSDYVDIVIARSTDGGATWSATVSVPPEPGNVLGPVVAALPSGRVVVVAWNLTEGNILSFTSSDYGATWGPRVRVNAVSGSATSVNTTWMTSMPSLVQDAAGRLYVAWADYGAGNRDILVSRSDDGGATWTSPVRVNDVATGDQWMPSLSVDPAGTLHAAWLDGRTDAWNAYYANSTDLGQTWSPNLRVSTAETPLTFVRPGDYLALATDSNGTAYVAWTDGRTGSLAIEFARSTPFAGSTPPPPLFPWLAVIAIVAVTAVALFLLWLLSRRIRRRRPPT